MTLRQSEQINELAAALCKAQAKIEGAVKDKTNPAFRSKYADLGACWDAIREPLSSNGLSVVQFPRTMDGYVEVETMLLHASGQFLADTFAIPVSKQDAHGYMSATTYARRGGLMAIAGIAPVDDDGVGAVGAPGVGANPPKFAQKGLAEVKADMEKDAGKPLASQYQVNKAKTAETWANNAIVAIGKLISDQAISTWWTENEKELDRLQEAYPALFDKVSLAADERMKQVPSNMAAG